MARGALVARLSFFVAALVCVLLGISLWIGTVPASAHATLERTVPAANADLATEPRSVVLSFDQPVSLALGNATVIGPDGAKIAAGVTTSKAGQAVIIRLRPGAGTGTYVVSYRVVSADTHPVTGGFYFRVGHGATTAPATVAGSGSRESSARGAASGSAPEDTTVRAVYAASRYAGLIGLLLLLGSAVFLVALWPAGLTGRRVVRLVWFGYGLLAVGSMGELVLQAPYAAGTGLGAITGVEFDLVVGTRFGTAHLVRLGLLALAAPVLTGVTYRPHALPRSAPARWAIVCAVPLAIGLLLTWAYSGHAGTTVPALSVPSDVVHLAAMAVWIGGLVVLATAVLPSLGTDGLQQTLPRWSRLAMGCVAALIVSGTAQTLVEVSGWSGLTGTTYGRLVLVKIGLLALVLVVANASRLWVRRHCAVRVTAAAEPDAESAPQPVPSPADVRQLRRGVAIESVVAAAAVAVAAVLVEAAPGIAASAPPAASTAVTARPITRHGAYRATVRKGDVIIHLKVDPAVVGVQYIYLAANLPNGRRLNVRRWTLSVSNDELGLERVNVPVLIDDGVGHHFAYGAFTMPTGGTWRISVTARTSDIDETIVSRTVRVRS